MQLKNILAGALVVLATAAVTGLPLRSAAAESPIVVELFTSQGCNSCPPADAFLGELAKRPDVVALAMHVDYWDYIGWKDPFANRIYTERQRGYSSALSQRFVYTPQMVVDGRFQDVGSDRAAITRLIDKARSERAKLPSVTIARADEAIEGPPTAVRVEGQGFRGTATIWLALYDFEHRTDVLRGENGGRRLADYNVVREFRRVGTFDGRPVTVSVDLGPLSKEHDACTVFVQAENTGPILAAMVFKTVKGQQAALAPAH